MLKKNPEKILDNQTHRLANKPSKYDQNIFNNMAYLVLEIQVVNESIFIQSPKCFINHGFFAAFKIAYDKNSVHDGATIIVQSHYVKETLANGFNIYMCAGFKSTPVTASVRDNDARSKILYFCILEFYVCAQEICNRPSHR